MKIALFSDIHANLPAFEAFLKDLDSRQPDAVYCLGDLVGYHIYPNEVIAEIRRRGIATLAGNHDLKVSKLAPVAPEELTNTGKNYAYHIIGAQHREYLNSLPAHIRLEYKLGGEQLNLMLVHGTPRSNDEYLLADLDENYVNQLMDEAGADILCAGHSHKPYHRVVTLPNGKERHVINIGSVGKPKDNNPMGCYIMISLKPDQPIYVEFIHFAYDVEASAKAIEGSPLPNEFADRLRGGY
ncbi:metallophosphatase family protein [Mucilaginibacter sp. HMF5004]|uniref:metallophosphoesterase family protein n=1 Tax=Mucilaginibacter rivuli TaxID=2857527 RepID=UPI001C5CE0F1|nr:metallophosphoesterase family protein [Mucilaginibacter rivuli]MBW4891474.1 metallophosphatase family protein [Mucilaginibacter rivuli]